VTGRIHNTDEGQLEDLLRRVRALENAAPLGASAVSNGHTRFIGNESLLVEGSQ
jgi:hypothetical protein